MSFIDARDIAVDALLGEVVGRDWALTGPESLTLTEVAWACRDSRIPARGYEPVSDAELNGRDFRRVSSLPAPRYPVRMADVAVTPESLALRELVDARRSEFVALLGRYRAKNPRLFGSVARGTAHEGSDLDILVEMDPADGNVLMRASGLMEEARELFGRDDVDVFPVQLLKRPISQSALEDAVAL